MRPLRSFFLLLFAALLALSACGGAKFTPIPAGARVLVIGDSITAAYGLPPEASWINRLARETGWQTINAGVSGDTTTGGLARLPALLDEHKPAALIIELGGNDMLRRQPDAAIISNITAMIELTRRVGAQPILLATPKPSIAGAVFSGLSDAQFYAKLAQEQQIPFVEKVLSKVLSQAELKIDQLHPNAEGHQRIGQAVAEALRKQGLSR